MTDPRTANLLGALALALVDDLGAAVALAAAHGAAAPAALVTIGTSPGDTIEGYRRALGLSHSGMVRLVDRLEADGLLERRRGPDARSVAPALTGAGEARMRSILAERRRALEDALAALSPDERDRLTPLLEKLLIHLTTDPRRADRICRLCELGACPQETCPVETAATDRASIP